MKTKVMTVMVALCLPFVALAKEPTQKNLLKDMAKMQTYFESKKPVDADEVIKKFPEAMRLLGYAVESNLPKQERIAAAVKLAIASTPFDETNTAADFLALDYRENTALYDREIEKYPNEALRNKFQIVIRRFANYNENDPDIVGDKNLAPKKQKSK